MSQYSEESWLYQIAECPDADLLGTLGAYSDWLEEQSDPDAAKIVRDLCKQGYAPLFKKQAQKVVKRAWLRSVSRQAAYRNNQKKAARRLQQQRAIYENAVANHRQQQERLAQQAQELRAQMARDNEAFRDRITAREQQNEMVQNLTQTKSVADRIYKRIMEMFRG